ncbi:MAG TPA: YihY/virulence factor BrkB family protein [Bacteroidota bacterium]
MNVDRRINIVRSVLRIAEGVWFYTYTIARRVGQHDVLFLASGLAFNGILTLIPLMLLLASALGVFLNSSALGVQQLHDILNTIFPPQPFAQQIRSSILSIVSGIVTYRNSLGVFGFLVLIWTATSLFDAIRSVLHRVFFIKRTRGLFTSLLHDVGFIFLAFVLFLATNVTIWMSTVIARLVYEVPVLQQLHIPPVHEMIPSMVVVVITAVMFYILYRYMTDEKPPNTVAIVSTVTSSLLWILSARLFAVYLADVSAIATIYGPYAFLLVLLFWIYYSSLIFVFGAIVGQVHWERLRRLREEAPF